MEKKWAHFDAGKVGGGRGGEEVNDRASERAGCVTWGEKTEKTRGDK
jgi:hypothetical protein